MTETENIQTIQDDSTPISIVEVSSISPSESAQSFTEKMYAEDAALAVNDDVEGDVHVPKSEVVADKNPMVADVEIQKDLTQVDLFPELEKKFGRKFAEEDLATDWKTKAQENEKLILETKEKLESVKHIFDNEDLLKIADLMNKGFGAKDILESMAINPADVPLEKKLFDFIKRENSYLKSDEDIELFAETNFGYGEDMDLLKANDPKRYFEVVKNIQSAVEAQDKFLNERKVSLLNKPVSESDVTQKSEAERYEKEVLAYKNTLNKHIDSLQDFKISDEFTQPFSKDDLKLISDSITYSGNVNGDNILVLSNVNDKDLLEALYLHKNKNSLLAEFKNGFEKAVIEKKSVEAFRKVSDTYDNVKGSQQQSDSFETQPITITPVRGSVSAGF